MNSNHPLLRSALAICAAALIALPATLSPVSASKPAASTAVTSWYYPYQSLLPTGYTACALGADLQTCINGAAEGDLIVIDEGVYTESITLDKAVSLYGLSDGATLVAVSGQRVLTVTGNMDSSTHIENLTFTGGNASPGAGGGIHLEPGATPLLANVVISGNTAVLGGGLYAYHKIVANNLTVLNNSATTSGGGIYVQDAITINGGSVQTNTSASSAGGIFAGALFSNTTHFDSVTLAGNTASSGTGGGAVLGNIVYMTNTTVANNIATDGNGGGISAVNFVVITGTTFRNNRVFGEYHGAGLYTSAALTATNSAFRNNIADGDGGGAYVGTTASLEKVDLSGNKSDIGGGMLVIGAVTMSRGVVFNNDAATGTIFENNGGGIATFTGASITGTQFISNVALAYGGGLYVLPFMVSGNLVITNAAFERNESSVGGGVMSLGADDVHIHNTRFISNVASDEGGGLQLVEPTSALLTNNRFTDNSALTEGGGGLYIAGGTTVLNNNFIAANTGVTTTGAAELGLGGPVGTLVHGSHNTFASKTSGQGLAIGVGLDGQDTLVLTNSIISGYAVGAGVGAFTSSVALNGVLWDNVTAQSSGSYITVTNAVTGAANFIDTAARNYHIQNSSAAKDAGIVSTLTTDIDDQARPNGAGYDLGADENNVNLLPVADPGPVQSVVIGSDVTLDGSGSFDPEGDTLQYLWTQVGGPPVTLSSRADVTPTFATIGAPTPYFMRFQLIVTDSLSAMSSPRVVTVTVTNDAPVAEAGSDQAALVGTPVALFGGASIDPNGHVLSYTWSQIGGAPVTLLGANTVAPTFTAPLSNTALIFRLVVNDSFGAVSAPDTVTVTVSNNAPVANAGGDQSVLTRATVTLNGSASADVDGHALTYAWTQTGGTAVALSSASSISPTFVAPFVDETLTFQLIVTDAYGASSAADTVQVRVSRMKVMLPLVVR